MNRDKLYSLFLHVSIAVLLVLVIVLAMQNRSLKSFGASPQVSVVAVGDTLDLRGLKHVEKSPDLAGSSNWKIVFLMSTTCAYCKENIPLWNELARSEDGLGKTFAICLASDSAAGAFMEEFQLDFPVFIPDDQQAFRNRNRIVGVPRTLHIDKNNVVRRMWVGPLTEAMILEIKSIPD